MRILHTLLGERERRGWSQTRMAEAAGISRQSYAAIESGGAVPSTEVALRLARTLGRPVEALFRLPDGPAERVPAAWGGSGTAAPGRRVRLTRVAGRPVAHPVDEAGRPSAPADGVVEAVGTEAKDTSGDADGDRGASVDEVDAGDGVIVRRLPDPPPAAALAVVGCDPAFGIVAETLRAERGIEVSWSLKGSRAALAALARGEAHVAGTHLRDAATGEWNGPWVRELVPFPAARIAFAAWEQGLLVNPDARPRIRGVGDLARRGVRVLNREEGSGSRMLLDEALAEAGIDPARLAGYATRARGHDAIAEGIAAGAADAGVATRAAGVARGLEVVPLREEAYELVIPNRFLDLPAVRALLDVLRRPGTRTQVEALGGYDGAAMGDAVS